MKLLKKEYLPYLIVVIALLPCIILRDFTVQNELRYLNIANDALTNHRFFTFYNNGEIYADKPPLYFWLLMLGKLLWGTHQMWYISLFSILPTIAIAEIMRRWTKDELEIKWSYTAVLTYLSTVLIIALLVITRMDSLMCLFITLALKVFWDMQKKGGSEKPDTRQQLMLGGFTFLALFTKGPVGVIVPILIPLVWLIINKKWKTFFCYWNWKAWGILLSCCAIWFACVYYEGGSEYLDNLLFHQTIDRAHNASRHARPFFFYALSVLYMMLPLALVIIGNIVYNRVKKEKKSTLQNYFFTIIITVFVVLSTFSSKLDVYLLPIYPFAIFLGMILWQNHEKKNLFPASKYLLLVPLSIICIAVCVAFVLSIYYNIYTDELHVHRLDAIYSFQAINIVLRFAPIVCGVCAVGMLYALWKCLKKKFTRSIIGFFLGIYTTIFIGSFTIPTLNPFIGYEALYTRVNQIIQEKKLKRVYTYRVTRASNLSTFLSRPISIIKKEKDVLAVQPGGILLYENDIDDIAGLILGKKVERVGGINIVLID